MQGKLIISIAFLSVILAGCDSKTAALKHYVEEVKQRPATPVEPIPTFKPPEKFTYSAANLRDPFTRVVKRANSGKISPDLNRTKEQLESYPMDSLKVTGMLSKSNKNWALIEAPDGTVYRVTVGNYLGQNFGKIVAINKKSIDIIETLPQGDGWMERPLTLTLETK